MSGSQFARQADPFEDEALRGMWFSSGRGTTSLANGDSWRGTLANPLGSGKLLVIHRLRVYVTTPSEYLTVILNPTINLPSFVAGAPNRRVGLPGSSMVVKIDAGPALGGGIPLPYQIPIEVNSSSFTEFRIDPGIDLMPGLTIGLNFTNAGGGPDSQVIFLGDFKEVPL